MNRTPSADVPSSSNTNLHTLNSVYSHGHTNDDNHSNIYTEPTLVNSCAPTPNHLDDPRRVPTMASSSVTLDELTNRNNLHNSVPSSSIEQRADFVQMGHFASTIQGQEMAITLQNNGHIIQTVFQNNPPSVGVLQQPLPPPPPPPHPQQFVESGECHIPKLLYPQVVPEFLPLCDLLFNIISLAGYFCDVVFDCIIAYTLFLNRHVFFMSVVIALILFSGGVCQTLSYRWHKRDRKIQQQLANRQQLAGDYDGPILSGKISPVITLIHVFYSGVLWRYFKLFTPVDVTSIKREVRDLCVLRMVHAFCEAAPMLLLQLYLLWRKPSPDAITDLNMISIFLSAFSLCWALASFSKNIRTDAIDKLVLTWLGVIFQFFWRFGTITSRVIALSIYQHVYGLWIFAVLILHWFSMLLWLLSPQLVVLFEQPHANPKHLLRREKFVQIAATAWVYCFCFINMENEPPRHRMVAFYVTMFLENVLLMTLSVYFDTRAYRIWYRSWVISLVLGAFVFGLFFMWVYYHFFHIRHLSVNDEARMECSAPQLSGHVPQFDGAFNPRQLQPGQAMLFGKEKIVNLNDEQVGGVLLSSSVLSPAKQGAFEPALLNGNMSAGVFNCRLNPALKRKKKKPSTVPPPPQNIQSMATIGEQLMGDGSNQPRRSKSAIPTSQMYRSAANSAMVTKQLCQSGTDTFWRKSGQSARSMSTSPAAVQVLNPAPVLDAFRLPSKHPFSSSLTSPKPVDLDMKQFEHDPNIHRPKPLMLQNQSIDLDAIGDLLQKQLQSRNNLECISHEEEDLFSKQGARPPVPGKEGDDKSSELDIKDGSPESALRRVRLEKVLEHKRAVDQFELESHRSHQTFSNETHRSRTTNRSKKYSTGMLRKKRNERSSVRSLRRKHDSYSSDDSSTDQRSSSGGEGDVESDNAFTSNHQRMRSNISRSLNPLVTPSHDIDDGVDPVILRAKDMIAQTDSSRHQITNYHAGSQNEHPPNGGPNTNRQLRSQLYSAKYKRHNTPL